MKSITLFSLLICLGACQQNKIETSQSSILEITEFNIKTEINETFFLEMSDRLQQEFLQNRKGFKKRYLVKKDNQTYIDIIEWDSKADADNALTNAIAEVCINYFACIDEIEKVKVNHHDILKIY